MTLHLLYVRGCEVLLTRVDKLLVLRFMLQPMLATCFGILDGVRDGRLRDAPYLWKLLLYANMPVARMKLSWFATARVLLIAVICDLVQQNGSMNRSDMIQTFWMIFALTYIPYVLIRGAAGEITRIVKRAGWF